MKAFIPKYSLTGWLYMLTIDVWFWQQISFSVAFSQEEGICLKVLQVSVSTGWKGKKKIGHQ